MADRYIPEHRRTQFKAKGTFRPDELRRRREEQQVEIRRQKREENIAKRRGIQTREGTVTAGQISDSEEEDAGSVENQVCRLSYFALNYKILPTCPASAVILCGTFF